MKLRRLSRTKDQVSSDPDRTLSVEESLHSIAVELHRGNLIAGQSLALQQKQVAAMESYLDITRAQMQAALTQTQNGVELVEGFLGPIRDFMSTELSRPPRITTRPANPPTVKKDGEHYSVEQDPEAEV